MMLPLIAISDDLEFDDSEPENKVPYVIVYRESEGAHEYTLRQREELLNDILEKDLDYEGFVDQKKKVQELMTLAQENTKNKASTQEKQKVIKALFSNFDKLVELSTDIEGRNPTNLDEAYKLISDEEYKFLYEMELANYFAMIRGFQEIEDDVTGDDATKYYFTTLDFGSIRETAPVILPQWITSIESGTEDEVIEKIMKLPESSALVIDVGSEMKLNADNQEKYIANILPSTVHAVYGKRRVNGTERLVPIATTKYTKVESHDHGLINTTTIILKKPLKDYPAENWVDEQLYVTLTSSVGPNTANIISWILTTFTDVTPDATTFASVAAAISNYPSNFALFNSKDAISLVKDIAWQARCAIWIKNKVAYIKYLSIDPTPVKTLTDSDIEEESLLMEYTETDDIITKFTAKWKSNYFVKEDIRTTIRHNLSKYGEQAQEYDFFIYNLGDLVLKSATFWAYRYANTWKKIQMTVFLNQLTLETHDDVTIDLTDDYFSDGPIVGVVEKAEYDSTGNSIKLTVWLPIKAGQMTKSDFAFPSSVSIDTVFPEIEDVLSGNAGNPLTQKIPNGQLVNPLSADFSDQRPPDFGKPDPSDASDLLPDNPTTEFDEVDVSDPSEADKKVTEQVKKKQHLQKLIGMYKKKPSSPFKKAGSKGLKGSEVTYTGYGTIIQRNEEKSTTVDSDDPDAATSHEYYDVRTSDNKTIPVKVLQIDPDDRIPSGTILYVSYDTNLNEHVMQPPVYAGDEIEEV
jgi:hypothetical protein